MPDKQSIVDQILKRLNEELTALVQAAQAAHEAATHEESKPEDEHDTRGLEASYLAGAQASRAADLQKLIALFRQLPAKAWGAQDSVGVGALVELKTGARSACYLLMGAGGGLSVQVSGKTVQVITPLAPLGEALLGKRVGDLIEVEGQNQTVREYELIGIS